VQKFQITCRVVVSGEVEKEFYVTNVNSTLCSVKVEVKFLMFIFVHGPKEPTKKSHLCSDVELDFNGRFIQGEHKVFP